MTNTESLIQALEKARDNDIDGPYSFQAYEHAIRIVRANEERERPDTHAYVLDEEHMNSLQRNSFEGFLQLVKHGAKFIDILVRKDAKEYRFEADFLKYMISTQWDKKPTPPSEGEK